MGIKSCSGMSSSPLSSQILFSVQIARKPGAVLFCSALYYILHKSPELSESPLNGSPPHSKGITTRLLHGVKRKISNFSLHPMQQTGERGFFMHKNRFHTIRDGIKSRLCNIGHCILVLVSGSRKKPLGAKVPSI